MDKVKILIKDYLAAMAGAPSVTVACTNGATGVLNVKVSKPEELDAAALPAAAEFCSTAAPAPDWVDRFKSILSAVGAIIPVINQSTGAVEKTAVIDVQCHTGDPVRLAFPSTVPGDTSSAAIAGNIAMQAERHCSR